MKRNLFFTAVIALMAVSCSQDQIVGLQEDTPIEFRIILDKQSKATSYTASNLASFNVTAWKTGESHTNSAHINQVDYDRGTDGSYTSASKYYWPASGGLTFYAYAPKAGSTNGITRSSEVAYSVSPLADTDNQVDFLFAKNSGTKDANGSGMALNFRHAMSQIRVKVKNSNSALKFNVTGWKIAGVDGTATFTFDDVVENTSTVAANSLNTISAAMWSGNSDNYTASYSKTVTSKSVTSTNSSWGELDGSAILIPQTAPMATGYTGTDPTSNPLSGAYLAIEYQALNTDNNAELVATGTWGCWPVQFEWAPGFRYNYVIDLAEFGYKEQGSGELDPIMDDAEVKFVTVTVDVWQPEDDNDAAVNLPLAVVLPPASLRFSTVTPSQTNTLSINQVSNNSGASVLEYSLDEGSTWTGLDYNTPIQFGNGTDILVRGTGFYSSSYTSEFKYFKFGADDVLVSCEGDVVKALIENTENPEITQQGVLAYLFRNCKCLVSAPTISATVISNFCCTNMFENCTNLLVSPALPADVAPRNCYQYMFKGCTSLQTVSDISATVMGNLSCGEMFQNCSNLLTAPSSLPAMTLGSGCYRNMFNGCTKLTNAPDLPAETLTWNCYEGMFSGCQAIVTPPTISATTTATDCCYRMFSGCSSLESAPVLLSEVLAENCYKEMFQSCTSMTTIHDMPVSSMGNSSCWSMFSNCQSLEDLSAVTIGTSASNLGYRSCLYMFSNCSSMTKSPSLPAMTLAEACYYSMFSGCTSLADIYDLPATTMVKECYEQMFSGCTSLVTAPQLAGTTLALGCYKMMFEGCTNLENAPSLPVMTLAEECYMEMLSGCSSLVNAPSLPSTTLAKRCYSGMFSYCSSLETAPVLPATSLVDACYEYMFKSCTHLNYVKAMFSNTNLVYYDDVSYVDWMYTMDWLSGVSSTGTFVRRQQSKYPARTQWYMDPSEGLEYWWECYIPEHWTIETATE